MGSAGKSRPPRLCDREPFDRVARLDGRHATVRAANVVEPTTRGEIELTLAGDGLDPDLVRRLVAIINAGKPLGGFEDGELQPIPFVEVSSEPTPAP